MGFTRGIVEYTTAMMCHALVGYTHPGKRDHRRPCEMRPLQEGHPAIAKAMTGPVPCRWNHRCWSGAGPTNCASAKGELLRGFDQTIWKHTEAFKAEQICENRYIWTMSWVLTLRNFNIWDKLECVAQNCVYRTRGMSQQVYAVEPTIEKPPNIGIREMLKITKLPSGKQT